MYNHVETLLASHMTEWSGRFRYTILMCFLTAPCVAHRWCGNSAALKVISSSRRWHLQQLSLSPPINYSQFRIPLDDPVLADPKLEGQKEDRWVLWSSYNATQQKTCARTSSGMWIVPSQGGHVLSMHIGKYTYLTVATFQLSVQM
jgi:hypothetical protein